MRDVAHSRGEHSQLLMAQLVQAKRARLNLIAFFVMFFAALVFPII
jgi:hypothetical protein